MIITDEYIELQRPAFIDVPDLERCLYVLQTWQRDEPNTSPYRFMKGYMLRDEAQSWVAENVLVNFSEEIVAKPDDVKPESRKDKYARMEKYALENIYLEFTTQQLVDISGLSAGTLTTWIKINGWFKNIGRGKWEARNAKDDRKSV